MEFKNRIIKIFSELLISSDDVARCKERLLLNNFVKNIEFDESDIRIIQSGGRKNCVYSGLDILLKRFCENKNIDKNEINGVLMISSAIDIYMSCYFWRFEKTNNKVSLEKIINNRGFFTKRIIDILIRESSDVCEILNMKELDHAKRLIGDMIIIRYSFKNKLLNYIKIKKKWYIELDDKILECVSKCNYINKDVRISEKKIILNKEATIKNIIQNNSFNDKIWIDKFSIIKEDVNEEKSIFLKKECKGVKKCLLVLNFLTNCKFKINEKVLKEIKENNELNEYLKLKKKLMTILTIEEADFVKKFNFFRLDYIMDNRTRLYIRNIPLNIQLEKIIRPVVTSEVESDEVIIKKYKEIINNYNKKIEIKEILTVLKEDKSKIDILIDFISNELKNKKIDKEEIIKAFREEKISIEIIFLQQVYDIVKRLGLDINYKISENIKKIIDEKNWEELESIGFKIEIKKWLISDKKWIETIWYNDASSNVLQILLMKLFISDEKIMRICNIFNNTTGIKDIYEYILEKIKEKEDIKMLSRKIIKKIIMPGLYGQTFVSLKESIEEEWKNWEDWNKMSKENKIKLIKKIEKRTWEELKEIGIDLGSYLRVLKRLPYEVSNVYWENIIEMPIILDKEKSLDRKSLLDRMKKSKKNEEKKSIKEKLNKDDINYIRKNIKIENKEYIKIRIKIKSNIIDKKMLSNAIAPSSNHSDDAGILFKTIEKLMRYGIDCLPIHDSVGTMIYYSPISKFCFKESNIEYIRYLLEEERFPFNIINNKKFKNKKIEKEREELINKREINKRYYKKNLEKIIREIMRSDSFFN